MMKKVFIIFFMLIFLMIENSFSFTTIKVHDWGNFTSDHKKRFKEIIHNVELIINSEQFKLMVESYRVNGVKAYVENNNKSNVQIYKTLILGAEVASPDIDLQWDISFYATVIPWMNSVIAYIRKGSNVIVYNSTFLPQDDPQHAKTICHEYVHLVGFYHDSFPDGPYYDTPAYAIGDICQYMYISYFPEPIRLESEELKEIECSFSCWFKGLFK